jgi:hypothetical protein
MATWLIVALAAFAWAFAVLFAVSFCRAAKWADRELDDRPASTEKAA